MRREAAGGDADGGGDNHMQDGSGWFLRSLEHAGGRPLSVRLASTLLGTLAIVVLSLTPDRSDPGGSAFVWLVHITPSTLQKSLHVVLYAWLTVAWIWTIRSSLRGRLIAAFGIAVTLGAVLEWLQTYVPGRFGSLLDIILNAVGALIGVALGFYLAGKLDGRPGSG
jgi:hypothetical protein